MSQKNENMEIENVEPKRRKKKNKKIIIIIVIVVAIVFVIIAIGGAISSMSKSMQAAMEEMASENEDTFKVEKQDVEQEITTSGTIIGIEKDAYVSPVTAKIEDIKVEVGQIVKKGDVLITYDASELGDNLEKVKIQAQSERAAGNESYEVANKAAGKVSEAKKRIDELNKDIKEIKKKISTLSKKVEKYENQIKAAEEAATTDSGSTTDTEGNETQTTEDKSSSQTMSAADQKAYKKAVSDLQEQNEKLAEKQAELAEQESIVAANEDVTVSESTKAQISANNQLSDMNVNDAEKSYDAAEAGITADKAGIVESIEVVKGAYANETQTLLTIIDADSIGVEFAISKDDLGSISKGQRARIVIGSNEYEGTVDYVSRVASNDIALGNSTSGTIMGRILIDNPDEDIYIGVSAKVYIFVGESKQTLVIPYETLNTDIDGDFVYIVNDQNKIERRDVTLGIYSDEYYEVLEGLDEGDTVITNVTKDMKPGDEYISTADMMTE